MASCSSACGVVGAVEAAGGSELRQGVLRLQRVGPAARLVAGVGADEPALQACEQTLVGHDDLLHKRIRRGVSRVPCRDRDCWHWEAPASLAKVVDVLHSVSRIVFSTHSTKCWAELSLGRLIIAHRVRPHVFHQGAGRESNLLSHVLHHGSRVCFRVVSKGPTKLWSEIYGALPLSYGARALRVAPVGLEPTTTAFEACTPTGSRSCIHGRRVVGQNCLMTALTPNDAFRRNHVLNRQSPFVFLKAQRGSQTSAQM